MSGKLYALSTGPGAADLITVRAARILGQLDVLYAPAGRKGGDSLALSIVREYLGAHTEGHGAAVAGGDLLHRAGNGHCRGAAPA